MKLADYLGSRDNNFNLLRLIAATAVIYSHSWALSLGAGSEPIGQRWGRTPSEVAVDAFFVISGLLVSQSWLRQNALAAFVKARVLRIFPALLVVLLLSVFLVGPLFTTLTLGRYFSEKETWRYLYNNFFMIHSEYYLPGVFEEGPYNHSVNGSLWTLQFEIKMYVAVAMAGLLGAFKQPRVQWILVIAYLAWYFSHPFLQWLRPEFGANTVMMRVSLCFFLGVQARLFAHRITLSVPWLFGLVSVALLMRTTIFTDVFYSVALAYVVLYLAYIPAGGIRQFNRLGDYSYGTYVYAFPIQQVLMSLPAAGVMHRQPLEFFVVATLLTWVAAIFSWHGCEKPALGYLKNKSALQSVEFIQRIE